MIDVNKHKFYLVQLLKDIYSDAELANCMGFKEQGFRSGSKRKKRN